MWKSGKISPPVLLVITSESLLHQCCRDSKESIYGNLVWMVGASKTGIICDHIHFVVVIIHLYHLNCRGKLIKVI